MLRSVIAQSFIILVPIAAATPLKASDPCPPRIAAYQKCPAGFSQSWFLPPLPQIDTAAVVEPVGPDLHQYHLCLKATEQLSYNFLVIWPDAKWEGATICGGFAGQSFQALSEPRDFESTAWIGPSLREIRPDIRLPSNKVPPPSLLQRVLEFVTKAYFSLPLDKTAQTFAAIGPTIKSTATPIIVDQQQTETRYQIRYLDELFDETSPFRFFFSDDIANRAEELTGSFSISNELGTIEFTAPGVPANVIGSLIFLGPDNYEVGSMLVSVAVPAD